MSANVFYWSFFVTSEREKNSVINPNIFGFLKRHCFASVFDVSLSACSLMYTFQLFDNKRSRWDEIFFYFESNTKADILCTMSHLLWRTSTHISFIIVNMIFARNSYCIHDIFFKWFFYHPFQRLDSLILSIFFWIRKE